MEEQHEGGEDQEQEENRRFTACLDRRINFGWKICQSVPSTNVIHSTFVDELKWTGDSIGKKSSLVAQNFQGEEARRVAKKSPTVPHYSQRILLSIVASEKVITLRTRDITKAYVQSRKSLERPVFITPPPLMNLSRAFVHRVVQSLQGIPESGL